MPDEITVTKKLWKDRGVLKYTKTITVMGDNRIIFHKGRTVPMIVVKEA